MQTEDLCGDLGEEFTIIGALQAEGHVATAEGGLVTFSPDTTYKYEYRFQFIQFACVATFDQLVGRMEKLLKENECGCSDPDCENKAFPSVPYTMNYAKKAPPNNAFIRSARFASSAKKE
tara:strand:- start:1965 stop:2324 length:360 start_codon:yes stop_codon:yes gene_type:complete